MGDLAEYITTKDWRWVEEEKRGEAIAEWVDKSDVGRSQAERVIETFRPIRKKILGAIQGNHEMAIRDTFNQNVHKLLCERLGVRNLGYSALVRLAFRWRRPGNGNRVNGDYRPVDLLLHHGWGGGRSDGADINRFNDLVRDYVADWYVAGHTHRYLASKHIRHYLTQGRCALGARVLLCGRSGTFLKTVGEGKRGYAEKSAMRPVHTGCLKLTYSPDKQDVVANV